MQLVDEGALDLDAPITDILPELRLVDPDVARQVTMRHLLTHTSGIDGDVFTDTGRGDDCLEKLRRPARGCRSRTTRSRRPSPTATRDSSSPGRVIEKLTGKTWDVAMRERLFTPLGLSHTVTLPEEALLFRAAVGHLAPAAASRRRAPVWGLPRSVGPAGLIGAATADVAGVRPAAPDRRAGAERRAPALADVGGRDG